VCRNDITRTAITTPDFSRKHFAEAFLLLPVLLTKISVSRDPFHRNFPGIILPEIFSGIFPKNFSGKVDERTNCD